MVDGGARWLAQLAWERARERGLPSLRDRLPEQVGGRATPSDVRLARQLARDTERVRREHARAAARHQAAVSHRDQVLRRARRALPTGAVLAGGSGLVMLVAEPSGVLWAVAGYGGVRASWAARRLRRPPAVPPPPAALPAPPAPAPHPRSASFPAVRRLEQCRVALHRLLPLVSPAGRAVAEEAWSAAADADAALRWQAARLSAAEPYRGVDAAGLASLEGGVAAQEGLVQAVADLVAACADPHGAARVQDLTDRLHGLAAGLREVR